MDVDRSMPGSILLTFECRFHSPEGTKHRTITSDISLSFNTPISPISFVIARQPIIEAPPCEEIMVTRTKSSGLTISAGLSYFASLRARFSRSSTKIWSVFEKETRNAAIKGANEVEIGFKENLLLKTGLNGNRRVLIQMENIDGVSCMQGTFVGSFRYTSINCLGFTSMYETEVTATFDIVL